VVEAASGFAEVDFVGHVVFRGRLVVHRLSLYSRTSRDVARRAKMSLIFVSGSSDSDHVYMTAIILPSLAKPTENQRSSAALCSRSATVS
jgi:hypothetical protein